MFVARLFFLEGIPPRSTEGLHQMRLFSPNTAHDFVHLNVVVTTRGVYCQTQEERGTICELKHVLHGYGERAGYPLA